MADEAGDAAKAAAGGCRADADTASAATASEIPQVRLHAVVGILLWGTHTLCEVQDVTSRDSPAG